MRKILAICLLSLISALGYSQHWETNFEKAKELATKENKTIIIVFQGSDWCAPCMKLEKEIWSNDEFIAHANNNYIMLKADFPKRKKNALDPKQQEHNNELAEQYNTAGYFPFVVIVNKDGDVLGNTGYKKVEVKKYIEILESFKL